MNPWEEPNRINFTKIANPRTASHLKILIPVESDWFLSNIYCTVTLYHLTDTVTLRQCRIVKLFFDAMHASLSLSLFIPFSVTLYTVTVTNTVTLRQCRTVKLFFDAMKASLSLYLSLSLSFYFFLYIPFSLLSSSSSWDKKNSQKGRKQENGTLKIKSGRF